MMEISFKNKRIVIGEDSVVEKHHLAGSCCIFEFLIHDLEEVFGLSHG